jgi:hypothetical protein
MNLKGNKSTFGKSCSKPKSEYAKSSEQQIKRLDIIKCVASKYEDLKGLEAFESGKQEKINVCFLHYLLVLQPPTNLAPSQLYLKACSTSVSGNTVLGRGCTTPAEMP